MRRKTWSLILMVVLFSGMARAANDFPIEWKVTEGGEQVDRGMALRLYDEACRWIEEHFQTEGDRTIRPNLTIHVGETCPDSSITNYCLSAASGDLYLPRWDKASPGAIIQSTLILGTLQLVRQRDINAVVKELLAEDSRSFVDARAMTQRPKHNETRNATRATARNTAQEGPQPPSILTMQAPKKDSRD